MHGRMRGLRERLREKALAVQRSCGHACGFVVARRFFRAPRNAVWSCVAMTLQSLGACVEESTLNCSFQTLFAVHQRVTPPCAFEPR